MVSRLKKRQFPINIKILEIGLPKTSRKHYQIIQKHCQSIQKTLPKRIKQSSWDLGILRLLHYKLRTLVALWGQNFMKNMTCEPKAACKFSKNVPEGFKTCFDTAKSKISKNAADPTKNYGFAKQKTYPWWQNTEQI